MRTATVGDIQKNFSKIIREIKAGEEIMVTKRGKPIAKIISLEPKQEIEWPDFYDEAIELKGKPPSQIITDDRKERV